MSRRMTRRMSRLLLVGLPLLLVVLVGSFAAVIVALSRHEPVTYRSATPDYGRAPSYALQDQNGRRVSSAEFAGKVQVVSYLFPYCTTYCPTTVQTLVRLRRELAAAGLFGSRVQFVIFNVDPAGSGPAELRTFLRQYGVDPTERGWAYLTGTPRQIREVVHDGFHVYYDKVSLREQAREIARQRALGTYTDRPRQPNALAEKAEVDYDVVHNDYLQIVAPDGRILQILDGNKATAAGLSRAVRDALR